jgi:hypothetical protein
MPAYSFQERFVPFVKDGSKNHTIRKRRAKGFAKKGDTLYLYYGMRTKHCMKLREELCTDARTILITKHGVSIYAVRLDHREYELLLNRKLRHRVHESLTIRQGNMLAWRDGFRPEGSTINFCDGSYELMLRWWKQTHELPFIGDIIYWQPKK